MSTFAIIACVAGGFAVLFAGLIWQDIRDEQMGEPLMGVVFALFLACFLLSAISAVVVVL